MSHEQDNQEVTHTVEMQIPAADAAELADAMTTVGDFLHNYSDTLRGEDTDTEEEKKEAKEEKPAAPAEEPRKAIRIELPRDDNGKLAEALRTAAHFVYAASGFVGGDDKLAREELREIENAPAAETLKPKNRQEEMAEEGKVPVNLLDWEGGGGTLARGEVYAVMGEAKSGQLTLCKIFAAVAAGAEFGGFSSATEEDIEVQLLLTDRGERDACRAEREMGEYISEWSGGKNNAYNVYAYSLRGIHAREAREEAFSKWEQERPDLIVIDGAVDLCDFWHRSACVSLFADLKRKAEKMNCAVLVVVPECSYDDMWQELTDTAKRECAEVFQIRKDDNCVFHVSIPAEGAPLEVFSFTREGKCGIPTIKEISAAGDLPF